VESGANDAEVTEDELEHVQQVARKADTGCTTTKFSAIRLRIIKAILVPLHMPKKSFGLRSKNGTSG
jgi:hypothetical protein